MWIRTTRTTSIPTLALSLVAGLLLAAPVAAEPDVSWGEELFAENCSECHMVPHDDDWFEARADEGNMGDYESLRTMVQGCATNFGLPWFDEEVDAVTAYLDHHYYEFD
ncbi:cytochrome c [Guyparkeria hydrothermalis]|uniref:c-type cytochrome n=1 Tax=Guyparkeria hydrothermalis TaxID=923 RepID=UPI00202139F1|nr:cytochrome c [Guyparkeria hydrothermalis]MCL7744825.1 cytochrome c [Guyparkeria hydrothermalis]